MGGGGGGGGRSELYVNSEPLKQIFATHQIQDINSFMESDVFLAHMKIERVISP